MAEVLYRLKYANYQTFILNELPRRKRTGYQPQKTKTIYAASGRGINPKEMKKPPVSNALKKAAFCSIYCEGH